MPDSKSVLLVFASAFDAPKDPLIRAIKKEEGDFRTVRRTRYCLYHDRTHLTQVNIGLDAPRGRVARVSRSRAKECVEQLTGKLESPIAGVVVIERDLKALRDVSGCSHYVLTLLLQRYPDLKLFIVDPKAGTWEPHDIRQALGGG